MTTLSIDFSCSSGELLMVWMSPAPNGVAMRHTADITIGTAAANVSYDGPHRSNLKEW
jgi:hypothetical protein